VSNTYLSASAPVLAALFGAVVIIGVQRPSVSVSNMLWIFWAAVAGGAVAVSALSGEWLASGKGAYAVAFLGGVTGSGLTSLTFARSEGLLSGTAWPPVRKVVRRAFLPEAHRFAGVVGALGMAGLAILLAALGLGWLALLLLGILVAVAMMQHGFGLSEGFFLALGLMSAAVVILGRLALSPLGLVGQPVPTVAIAALVASPWLTMVIQRSAWRDAFAGCRILDLSPMAVALVIALAWQSLFWTLSRAESVAQLVRIGEDHLSHLLMLEATRASGTVLGESEASLAVTRAFAGYFPGGSIWQASVGGLLGAGSTEAAYVWSTSILFALLAGSAVSAAGRQSRSWSTLPALGVLLVGIVGARATLAMYELGFPGHLLVAVWIVDGLLLLLPRLGASTADLPRAILLLGLAIATWWTWNLAALVLLLPVLVIAGAALRDRVSWSVRRWLILLSSVAVLGLAGIAIKRSFVLTTLDELSIEGGVFRAIPFWLAFALILALPVACNAAGQELPLRASALVLGMAAATLVLITWQVARVGTATYYSYKLEYLLLALGWAAGALAIRLTLEGGEHRIGGHNRPVATLVAVLSIAASLPMLSWTGDSYRGWLAARGVLGPDPALACAVRTSAGAPDGSVALAVGFGDALTNYLATRATDVGTGSNLSAPLWSPVLNQPDPTTWPWAAVEGPIVVVSGAEDNPPTPAEVVAAARAAGAEVIETRTGC
jgi:hypothetical protein